MASVDVTVDTVIARRRQEVAAYAADPENAPAWYVNISEARWLTSKSLATGSAFQFTARFLRRTLTYTYEVIDLEPDRRLVMRTAQGPFPMETTYEWHDASADSTRMTLRNRGEPSGFFAVAAPVLSAAMRRATSKDLARLKSILESADR